MCQTRNWEQKNKKQCQNDGQIGHEIVLIKIIWTFDYASRTFDEHWFSIWLDQGLPMNQPDQGKKRKKSRDVKQKKRKWGNYFEHSSEQKIQSRQSKGKITGSTGKRLRESWWILDFLEIDCRKIHIENTRLRRNMQMGAFPAFGCCRQRGHHRMNQKTNITVVSAWSVSWNHQTNDQQK